jgi:Flp pilus assembly protein TadG
VKKVKRSESGQVIVEAALMLPLLVFIAFGMIDLQWSLSNVGDLNYIVTESARCQAIGALPCNAPNTPAGYAAILATQLHLRESNLTVISSGCNTVLGTCELTASYRFKPLGVWFPPLILTRTGTASLKTAY